MMKRIIKLSWLPILIVALGIGLNELVSWLNGGMPVPSAATYGKWVDLTKQTRLGFLGDILPNHYSIGDVLIVLGLLVYIFTILANFKHKREVTI